MPIVGFGFTKIQVEKQKQPKGKVSINSNVSITNAESYEIKLGDSSQKGIRFEFSFTTKYTPDIANISLTGEVFYMGTEEVTEEVLKEWDENKKVSKKVVVGIMNTILSKCNVQAIVLSHELNLPSPVPLPRVNIKQVDDVKDDQS